ncbi:MAG: hypothetical protein ACLU4J_16605 [Butyricimonas paravirosa]
MMSDVEASWGKTAREPLLLRIPISEHETADPGRNIEMESAEKSVSERWHGI